MTTEYWKVTFVDWSYGKSHSQSFFDSKENEKTSALLALETGGIFWKEYGRNWKNISKST